MLGNEQACVLPCIHLCAFMCASSLEEGTQLSDTLRLVINIQNLQRPETLLYHHVPQTHPISPSAPSLPSWQSLPLSAGARSGGSQSANLPSICPPPQCQLTPATPHQHSAGRPSPNLFPLPTTHPPPHSSVSIPGLSSPTHTPDLIRLGPALPHL